MQESRREREAQMNAIKHELKGKLWADPHERLTHGRYLSLFHLNPVPMWIYEVHTQQILDANEAAVQTYGYTLAEFLCLTLRDLRPPEDVPKFLELTHELPSSDRTGPWRHRLKGGTVIQVLITSHSVDFNGRASRLVMAESLAEDPDLD